MATYDLEEQEQIDALKAWWKRNGNTVILSIAVFAVTIGGLQGWRYYQKTQTDKASVMYQSLQAFTRDGNLAKIRETAGYLMDLYPSTPYAGRAALVAAKVNFESGDPQAAKSAKVQLQWALDRAREDEARDMARLRLSSVLLDEKDYVGALKLLDEKHGATFDGLYADARGDVLAAQGKAADARAAYKIAMEKMEEKSLYRQFVQAKLDAQGE